MIPTLKSILRLFKRRTKPVVFTTDAAWRAFEEGRGW